MQTSTPSKRKLTSEKNLLQPEPTPNRSAPPRPTSRLHTSSTQAPKLPDFTEDPFRDYRYEDPFNIVDPFTEDAEDFNANKSNETGKLDPFGYGTAASTFTSFENSFTKGFDTDFSNTLPLARNKAEKNNSGGKFDADFKKAFSAEKLRPIEARFFDNARTKPSNVDDAFSARNEKSSRRPGQEATQHRWKAGFSEKKSKNENGKNWNGNNATIALTEEEQFVWASEQSIKAEEERRRCKEKEEADLALALELSKKEKSGKL